MLSPKPLMWSTFRPGSACHPAVDQSAEEPEVRLRGPGEQLNAVRSSWGLAKVPPACGSSQNGYVVTMLRSGYRGSPLCLDGMAEPGYIKMRTARVLHALMLQSCTCLGKHTAATGLSAR